MILYNVTINIDHSVEEDWLQWMKDEHIPAVMNSGLFQSHHFYRLLLEDGSGGTNYSIQYFATSMQEIEEYLEHHAPRLMAQHNQRYAGKHAAFRTVLEEVI